MPPREDAAVFQQNRAEVNLLGGDDSTGLLFGSMFDLDASP